MLALRILKFGRWKEMSVIDEIVGLTGINYLLLRAINDLAAPVSLGRCSRQYSGVFC